MCCYWSYCLIYAYFALLHQFFCPSVVCDYTSLFDNNNVSGNVPSNLGRLKLFDKEHFAHTVNYDTDHVNVLFILTILKIHNLNDTCLLLTCPLIYPISMLQVSNEYIKKVNTGTIGLLSFEECELKNDLTFCYLFYRQLSSWAASTIKYFLKIDYADDV